MLLTRRFQAIEVNVPSGSTLTVFKFDDQPQLTGKDGKPVIINAIELYSPSSITKSPVTGSDLMTVADIKKSFLTLYQGDLQTIYNLPLVNLMRVDVNDNTQPFIWQPFIVNLENVSWTKCQITLPSAPASTGRVYAFGIHYSVGY